MNPTPSLTSKRGDSDPNTWGAWFDSVIDGTACFWTLLLIVTAWKAFAASRLGLIFDECYYWEWSLHPQFCYFDHPPLTAWMIASGASLLGHTALAVRFWAIVSGILLVVAGRLLASDMFGRPAGNRAGIFLLLVPIFAGNSFLMTPDTCLIPAWAFAIYFAWKGCRQGECWGWWLAAGAAAGMGMLAKYTMVLFYVALILVWVASPGNRRRIFLGTIIAGSVSLLFFLPVIWWNQQNGWVSFAHQLNHGFRNEHDSVINLQNLSDYCAFLVVLTSPVLGLLCFRSASTRLPDERFRFLAIFFWTVVLFFGFSAGKAHIEANWPMAAFVTGLIMVAGGWESYGVAWKRTAVIVLLVADIGAVAGISFLLLPKESPLSIRNLSPDTTFISKITGSAILADSAGKALGDFRARIEEFLGPEAVAASIRSKFRQSGADFLCLSTYQLTGVMSFYAPDIEHLTWLPDHGRVRFPWINDSTWKGKTALVAEWPRRGPSYSALFAELSPAQPLLLEGIGSPVFISIGRGYIPENVPNR